LAIYHCSLRVFSRERGHSAVAAAAYRSGQKLVCERTGTIHRYEKRRGVVTSFILTPGGSPDKFSDRMTLWNAAEEAETRKNSRVAREVIIALPHELGVQERERLTRDMALYLVEKYRVTVDVAIHSPVTEDGHDLRNHHAHLLFTTRELTPEGLGAKTRILDDKITGPQQIEIIREVWETLANDALSRTGHSDVSIDRRTLEAQGVERVPQIHEGKVSTYAEEFRKFSKSEDNEGDGDEDEDSGKGDTDTKKSGSGDKGNISPDMAQKEIIAKDTPKEAKVDTVQQPQYDPIDKDKSRSEFNAEIKALNQQRKEFPDKPLNLQIVEIEKEIDHLDHRVERLETLLDKTSLPQKLQRLIGEIATKAKEFLAERVVGQVKRELTQAEKAERHERQIAHYGRTYRESIHTQIKEMKEKIETLQSRETEFKKYRTFVSMIETEVINIRATQKLSPATTQKPSLETAQQTASKAPKSPATAKIPAEFKPSTQTEKLQQVFSRTLPIEHSPSVKIETAPQIKTAPATIKETPITREAASTSAKTSVASGTAKPEPQPHDYKIKANPQTQKMLDKIQTELKQQKGLEKPQPEKSPREETLKGKFQKPERPPVKERDVIAKTKAEAQKKRENIPPEFRARPYTEAELNPKPQPAPKAAARQDESVLDKFRKIWKHEKAQAQPQAQPKQAEQPQPRRPMASAFNQAAAKPNKADFQPDMEQKPNPQ
jgi:hypothetical protein